MSTNTSDRTVVPEETALFLAAYSIKQAAEVLCMHHASVRLLLKDPNSPLKITHNLSGHAKGARISKANLAAFLESRRVAPDLPSQAKAS